MLRNIQKIKDLEVRVFQLEEENEKLRDTIVAISVDKASGQKIYRKVLAADFIHYWLKMNRSRWQLTTYEGYRNQIRKHIAPYFGQTGFYLSEITAEIIQRYLCDKIASGLSPNTVRKHFRNLSACFKYAKKLGLILDDPTEEVIVPGETPYIANIASPTEIISMLTVTRGSAIFLPILLAAFLGLRRSEVLGLKWSAVNFENGTITVKRKLVRTTEDGKDILHLVSKMKNKSSRRTLSIPGFLLLYLRLEKQRQSGGQSNLRKGANSFDDLICKNEHGETMSPTNVSNTFARMVKKYGFQYVRFHDLRHSCASILYEMGYELKDIQEWLGHSQISTTADLYVHLGYHRKNVIAKSLQQLVADEVAKVSGGI